MTESKEAVRGEMDPAWHLMPEDQADRVFGQDMCDIDPTFLGFTDIYLALSHIIPTHWTVVDLGCAYAPQAHIFKNHKAYIGVDASDCERFSAPNTTHYRMTIAEFIEHHAGALNLDQTFAICSYVPPWYGADNLRLARENFKNVFTYYPAGTLQEFVKWRQPITGERE
ncbi:hypothetical protein ATER59S_02396 [Aquamicrobium terrae]